MLSSALFFNCSNYIFHKNSTEGPNWETKTLCCQNSSECDLVSIKEEKERNFTKKSIKKLPVIKYFIGLKKNDGKRKWLSDQTTADPPQQKSPWTSGQPSGIPLKLKFNCSTIYGKFRSYLGWFDDMSCRRPLEHAAHICESAVSCTKY